MVSATHPNFLFVCYYFAVALSLKRGAKVRLFSYQTNFWAKKMEKNAIFFVFGPFGALFRLKIKDWDVFIGTRI